MHFGRLHKLVLANNAANLVNRIKEQSIHVDLGTLLKQTASDCTENVSYV